MGQCASRFPFLASDQKCLVKQSNLLCQICQTGFIVDPKGKCVPEKSSRSLQETTNGNYTCTIQNCQTCAPANNCTNCVTGFQLASPNFCLRCPDPNCQSCKEANICETCKNVGGSQYQPSPTG